MINDRGHFMLTDNQYNVVKKLVQVVMPAFSALYFALAAVWSLPGAEQVLGTTAAIATFLGVTLGISSREYEKSGAAYDGTVTVTPTDEETTTVNLQLNDVYDLGEKKAIKLKIDPQPKDAKS